MIKLEREDIFVYRECIVPYMKTLHQRFRPSKYFPVFDIFLNYKNELCECFDLDYRKIKDFVDEDRIRLLTLEPSLKFKIQGIGWHGWQKGLEIHQLNLVNEKLNQLGLNSFIGDYLKPNIHDFIGKN